MNALQQYLATSQLNPIDAMNQLQNAGIISDNCVGPEDVAAEDCAKATHWLSEHDTDILWI